MGVLDLWRWSVTEVLLYTYIEMYAHICIFVERFSKTRYGQFQKKLACNANAKFIDCVLERRFSHCCVDKHLFMMRPLPQHDLQTLQWHWHYKLDFWAGPCHI